MLSTATVGEAAGKADFLSSDVFMIPHSSVSSYMTQPKSIHSRFGVMDYEATRPWRTTVTCRMTVGCPVECPLLGRLTAPIPLRGGRS